MLITEVPSTFDPTLPLLVPQLPNPLDRRWVADSIAADGAVASWTDLFASEPLTPTSTSSPDRRPVAGTVDSLRAVTFDGVDDYLNAVGLTLSAQTEATFYGVVKLPATPSGTIIIETIGGVFLGMNSAGKFGLFGNGTSINVAGAMTPGKWYAIAGAVKAGSAGAAQSRVMKHDDSSSVFSNAQTFNAFGNYSVAGNPANAAASYREVGLKIGVAHSEAQMVANLNALKTEYGLT